MANPFMSKTAGFMPGDYDLESQKIDRARKMSEMLQSQALQQENPNQMVGDRVVRYSPLQGLAKMLQAYGSVKMQQDADQRQSDLVNRQQSDFADTAQKYASALRGTPEQLNPLPQGQEGPPELAAPAVPGSRDAALQVAMESNSPTWRQMAMTQMMPKDPVVVGRSLVDPHNGQVVGVDQTWQAEQAAARNQRLEEQAAARQSKAEADAARREDQRVAREDNAALRRELAGQASADRRFIAGLANSRQEQKNIPKLPASALKMQQEELDAIGTNSSINADLKALEGQIDSGKLQLGLGSNAWNKAKNFIGASDEQSRNLSSFQSTLEKLRNDSLRLNKGVQTEGDAQRAWNELVANINDPKVVKQRMGEIQRINERAANLRRMNVDNIRSNFGVEPMDTSAYSNQPAAIGGSMPGQDAIEAELRRRGVK